MADFNFFLNRQGVRGPQGPQGEQGFSPDITVETDTLSEYILRITNEGGYFLTTNLREHKEDRGGTYIRYDRDTGVMYAGDPDVSSIDNAGVIRIAKDEDFAGDAEDAAVTPKQAKDYITSLNLVDKDSAQSIDGLKTFKIINATRLNIADMLDLENKGNKITYSNGGKNIIGISSDTDSAGRNYINIGDTQSAGLVFSGMYGPYVGDNTSADNIVATRKNVTTLQNQILNNANTYNGKNTFEKDTAINGNLTLKYDLILRQGHGLMDQVGTLLLFYNAQKLTIDAANRDLVLDGKSVIDADNNIYLTQANVEAGDNITIEKTDTGIKISGQAGGGIGDVTLAGDNNFTGSNTFSKDITVNAKVKANNLEVLGIGNIKSLQAEDASITGTISSLGEINAVSINAAGIKNNQTNKYYLTQGTITAGDNVTIEEVDEGVKVSATGGISQEVFDALVARVVALEALIDGGNASDTYPSEPQKIDANLGIDSSINTGETSNSVDITVEDN